MTQVITLISSATFYTSCGNREARKCNLFSNENGEVAILLVDARAERDETHEEDADGKAPQDQLPVAKVIHKATCILQQLQRPHQLSSTFTKHHHTIAAKLYTL